MPIGPKQKGGFLKGAVVSLLISGLLSWAAVITLNRYLGPMDEPDQITKSTLRLR